MAELGIRAANRARLEREILARASEMLAESGASGLTLRGVATRVGIAPSAIYRYYPGIDALLTALIIEAYQDLGDAARAAAAPPGPAEERVLRACRAVRSWAIAHPHRYALIYGTPVPGYTAPEDTIGPASAVGEVLARILAEAGPDDVAHLPSSPAPPVAPGMVDDALASQLGMPPAVAVPAIRLWTGLFGMVSFELFGHWKGVVPEPEDFFEEEIRTFTREVLAAVRDSAAPAERGETRPVRGEE